MGPWGGADLRFLQPSARPQLTLRGHEYGASVSRGVSVYSPAFAGTKLYCLVTEAHRHIGVTLMVIGCIFCICTLNHFRLLVYVVRYTSYKMPEMLLWRRQLHKATTITRYKVNYSTTTRGNPYKLFVNHCRINVRKHF